LHELGAEFKIINLSHTKKIRTSDKSLYQIFFKDRELPLVSKDGGPSLQSVLSESDKRILALSFFLAEVERNNNSSLIVLLDDPVSSFDNERKKAIARILGNLKLGKRNLEQLIILTHDAGFLRELNSEPGTKNNTFLVIEKNNDTSLLNNSKFITEFIEDNHKKRIKHIAKMKNTGKYDPNFQAECRKIIEHVFELKHHELVKDVPLASFSTYAKLVFNDESTVMTEFERLAQDLHAPLHNGSLDENGEVDNEAVANQFFKCLSYI
jgi:wobble nucleotide-excising tRNase